MTGARFRIALKRYLPKSFLGRSIMIIITPLIVVQVVSTWIFYDRHWDTVTRRLADSVATEIALIINTQSYFRGSEEPVWAQNFASELGFAIISRPGEILPNAPPVLGTGILDTRLANAMRERVRRPFQIDTWSHDRLVR